MRWFCFSILFLNGIYAVWHIYTDNTQVIPKTMESSEDGDSSIPSIKLLGELSSEERDILMGNNSAQGDKIEERKSSICKYIGPFELTQGEQFVSRMYALEIMATLTPLVIDKVSEYMLYLEPSASSDDAAKQLGELQSKHIDSYIITEGELNQGISLGLFKQKPLAEQLQQNLLSQGYNVKIKELSKEKKELWAYFDGENSELLSDELWQKITNKSPELQLKNNPCESPVI